MVQGTLITARGGQARSDRPEAPGEDASAGRDPVLVHFGVGATLAAPPGALLGRHVGGLVRALTT